MDSIRILFISIEGNTRSFVEHLTRYAMAQHIKNKALPEIKATEISEQTDFADETSPIFASSQLTSMVVMASIQV